MDYIKEITNSEYKTLHIDNQATTITRNLITNNESLVAEYKFDADKQVMYATLVYQDINNTRYVWMKS